ncbi:hypothetical protein [Corynebacterium bovis]|nr:hypothetical protein [Corynebacterium bovis]
MRSPAATDASIRSSIVREVCAVQDQSRMSSPRSLSRYGQLSGAW